jgi:3-methylcrotonyl-CoA carboxylase alpha subunit
VAVSEHTYSVAIDPVLPAAQIVSFDGRRVVFRRGEAWSFGLPDSARVAGGAALSDGALQSPMPGRIVSVSVRQGQNVTKGQTLLSLEAMKMEHALIAPFDGTVGELSVSVGDQVAENMTLVRIVAGLIAGSG